MKKFRCILIMLMIAIAISALIGLVACDEGAKLDSISVENAKTEFRLGDEFELGAGFIVYAHYSDGAKVDVTAQAEIKKENGFDMNVAGNYQITVSYGGKREVYTVYVGNFENILRKIELDIESVRTQYELGDDISFDGLKINCTYENAQGNNVLSSTTSLKGFDVEVKGEGGNVIDETFTTLGTYTVTVSKGSVKATYSVEVDGVNLSCVESAIKVGKIFQSEVISGTQQVEGALHGGAMFKDFEYEYEYGNNFTHVSEQHNSPKVEDFLSIDNEGIFCISLEDGDIVPSLDVQASMMGGPSTLLWYFREEEFGIENALKNLYAEAKACSNKDLQETANEATREYSFSFSGLKLYGNSSDYYETTVSFKLGENYNIESAVIMQDYYENNIGYAGMPDYTPSFITNSDTGITVPNQTVSYTTVIKTSQATGVRTAENPYSRDMFKVQAYKLKYNGEDLGDNSVINCSMANPNLVITIDSIYPSTATFYLDALMLNYEGSHSAAVDSLTVLVSDGFTAYRDRDNDNLCITLQNGGVWKLILKTEYTEKSITFDVVGANPTEFTAQVGNEASGSFYAGNEKTVALASKVHFYCAVDEYANAAQTAQITSNATEFAYISQVMWNGVKCFEFYASESGVYEITVTSDAVPSLARTFTVTVNDVPDFAELLKGEYTTTDRLGNIFTLTFTPDAQSEGVSGTLSVTKTPTEEDGTPITTQATNETLTYSVNIDSLSVTLTHVSGTPLGVDLTTSAQGTLTLEDQYGSLYPLTRRS